MQVRDRQAQLDARLTKERLDVRLASLQETHETLRAEVAEAEAGLKQQQEEQEAKVKEHKSAEEERLSLIAEAEVGGWGGVGWGGCGMESCVAGMGVMMARACGRTMVGYDCHITSFLCFLC
jgi:hypothetical protein